MKTALYMWAVEERLNIANQLRWFGAGSVLTSPSGEDITDQAVERLKKRLHELDVALKGGDGD